jgi:hypothetical protein
VNDVQWNVKSLKWLIVKNARAIAVMAQKCALKCNTTFTNTKPLLLKANGVLYV